MALNSLPEQPLDWCRDFALASPEPTIVFDAAGAIVLVNSRAQELFGRAGAELAGSSIAQLLAGIDLQAYQAAGSGLRVELAGRRSTADTFTAQVSLTPVGSLHLAVVQDVSEQKRFERDRAELLASERAARSEVERASTLKDDFLATLSHELRTPLNAMLGWTQILRGHRRDADIDARAVETIERNIRLLAQLIDDLLDMSRISSGKLRLDVLPVAPVAVIQAALEIVAPAAQNKGIVIDGQLDAGVEPVLGDAARLQQVVWNLLANAVKFTPKGGTVRISLSQSGSFARIEVADSGEGIDPAFLPHLFERFRQADSSARRTYGGLGLGLSIVRSLVEMHGGTVRAESAGRGAGATFTVLLPLAKSAARGFAGEPIAPPVPMAIRSIKGLRVLVVDDEPDARELLRRILETFETTVFVAASAAEALGAVSRHRPDVILSDIGMPEEDGYELMRKVRALDREQGGATPAAALTAYVRNEDKAKAIACGFQLHLAKPFDPARVAEVVAQLVRTPPSRSRP